MPQFVKDCEARIPGGTRCCPKERDKSYRAVAMTSVMSKWYATSVTLRLEKEEELEGWQQLHVGGIDGISCQHFEAMMAEQLQKHWEWQEDRRKKHVTRQRSETHNVVGQHGDQDQSILRKLWAIKMFVHGWITAAALREMAGLEGQATFENVENIFLCTRVHPPRER